MKTVITYGTYDILHRGHINLLRRARGLGDYLIVGLSTDGFNEVKGKHAFFSYDDRLLVLKAVRYVDQIIPERTWEQKITDVVELGVDVFVMGDDWRGEFDFLERYCEVVYLPRTHGISTTGIREQLRDL